MIYREDFSNNSAEKGMKLLGTLRLLCNDSIRSNRILVVLGEMELSPTYIRRKLLTKQHLI